MKNNCVLTFTHSKDMDKGEEKKCDHWIHLRCEFCRCARCNRLQNVIFQGKAQKKPGSIRLRPQTQDCRLFLSTTRASTWSSRGPCKAPTLSKVKKNAKLLESCFASSPKWTRREIIKGNPQKTQVAPPVAVANHNPAETGIPFYDKNMHVVFPRIDCGTKNNGFEFPATCCSWVSSEITPQAMTT